jgi:microcin C transport system substrate-binding protein
VDNAQMTNRERTYDFDLLTHQMPMNYIPGSGLMQYFGSATADVSVFNLMGLQSEAVDHLIRVVLQAQSQEELTPEVRALDRVLRAERFWVPQWFKDSHTVAYFDMYDHPDPLPPYALGHLDFWWFNAERAEVLRAAGAIR